MPKSSAAYTKAYAAKRQRIHAAGHVSSKPAAQAVDATFTALEHTQHGKPSAIDKLDQQGSARIRFPNTPVGALHAVLINTAGGLTGDDHIQWTAGATEHSHLCISTAACEKVYRSHGPSAIQTTRLTVKKNARLEWLPQETIVFNGARLSRTMTVDLEPQAEVLCVESIVLGRQAMHESIDSIVLKDRWRIYRQGRLIHAEDVSLNTGDGKDVLSKCMLHHYSAFSTVVAITDQPPEQLDNLVTKLRTMASSDTLKVRIGASVIGSRLIVRVLAYDSFQLRRFLIPCIQLLNQGRAIPVVWKV